MVNHLLPKVRFRPTLQTKEGNNRLTQTGSNTTVRGGVQDTLGGTEHVLTPTLAVA